MVFPSLILTGVRRIARELSRDQAPTVIFALLAAASLILGVYWTRNLGYISDDTMMYTVSDGLNLTTLITSHNGHLIIPTRIAYAANIELLGGDYLGLRALQLGTSLLTGVLLFVFLRRRLGGYLALGPAAICLFLGGAGMTISTVGVSTVISLAAGLGAFLLLERPGARRDAAAFVLVLVSVTSFATGVAMAIGVTVWLLLRGDRHRAWVGIVPILLYVLWFLLARDLEGVPAIGIANPLFVPAMSFDLLAAELASLAGLSQPFAGQPQPRAGMVPLDWGRVLAVPLITAVAVAATRYRPPALFWGCLAMVAAFWVSIGLTYNDWLRAPSAGRYVLPGAIMLLTPIAVAARPYRRSKALLGAVLALSAVGLCTNVAATHDASLTLADRSNETKTVTGVYDLVGPDAAGLARPPLGEVSWILPYRDRYFEGVERNGSYGFSEEEIAARPESERELADRVFAHTLGVSMTPAAPALTDDRASCERVQPQSSAPGRVTAELPPGGAIVSARGGGGASLARFAANPTVGLGTLTAGSPYRVAVPTDSASHRWRIAVATDRSLRICPLPSDDAA